MVLLDKATGERFDVATQEWIDYVRGRLDEARVALWERVQHGRFHGMKEAQSAVKVHADLVKLQTLFEDDLTQLGLAVD